MLVNLCKWASRHRKIAKSGHRVAAETIPFRRRWRGCMISVNLEAIWGMSVNICAVVIAISMFTMAVEYVYGWSRVKPLAEDSWTTAYQWSDGLISGMTNPERVDVSESLSNQAPGTPENLTD